MIRGEDERTRLEQGQQAAATDGQAPSRVGVWIKTARPFSLSASVSPILVGTALAASDGRFDGALFAATLLASMLLQVAANYFNEYFDHRYQLDTAQSLGASTAIFQGTMSSREVFAAGAGSVAIAGILGLYLIARVGPQILLFGLAAVAILYFYSARPVKLAQRGLGDPAVFVAMGFLMVWGAYYVQIPRWSWSALAASVPVSLLVVAILNMNNLRDYPDDAAVAKRTVVVRFGERLGRRYEAALILGAYAAVAVAVAARLLPVTAIIAGVTLPRAIDLARTVLSAGDRRAFIIGMKRISALHLSFGVALAAGIVIAALARVPS